VKDVQRIRNKQQMEDMKWALERQKEREKHSKRPRSSFSESQGRLHYYFFTHYT